MPLSPTAAETITGPGVGEVVVPDPGELAGSGEGASVGDVVGSSVGSGVKQMCAPSYAVEMSEWNEMDDDVETATPCGPIVPSYSTPSTVMSSKYDSR